MAKKTDTSKTELKQEIVKFVYSMRGKARANNIDLKKMFGLYNEYFRASETRMNCDLCAIRIFSKLEKVAKEYVNTNK
jgi:hypothetical protein